MSSRFMSSIASSNESVHTASDLNERSINEENKGQQQQSTSVHDATLSSNTALKEFLGKNNQTSTTTTTNMTVIDNNQNITMTKSLSFPFPEELQRILKEVSTKGSSSVLPWSYDERKRRLDRPGLTNAKAVGSTHDQLRRHHEYYNNQPRRSSSGHKRARLTSVSLPSRHLQNNNNRSHFASATSSASRTTTATATMVIETKGNALNTTQSKSFPNGAMPLSSSSNSNLFVLRPQTSTSQPISYQNGLFHPSGSLNRGTTSTAASGSEYEDTSQYECDSEGTSATSNSEMSFSSIISKRHGLQMGNIGSRRNASFTIAKRSVGYQQYNSVREVLHVAINQVLDYYYTNRGGYKSSLTEQRIQAVEFENNKQRTTATDSGNNKASLPTQTDVLNAEELFQKRKKRLLEMLGRYCEPSIEIDQSGVNLQDSKNNSVNMSPPFTIQRIAEVLMEPERYYTQTHKLCNSLEKLLLVTSPITAFGDSDAKQSHQDETDIVAYSKERSRVRSELRQRHRKSRRSKSSQNAFVGSNSKSVDNAGGQGKVLATEAANNTNIPDADNDDDDDESTNEILDAAARATLRNKFDHVGIDPHSETAQANSREVMAMIESRRLTNSPPPPPLSQSALRQLQRKNSHGSHSSSSSPSSSPESNRLMLSPRVPSPVLYHSTDGSPTLLPLMAPMLSHPSNFQLQQQNQHSVGITSASGTTLLSNPLSIGSGTLSMTRSFPIKDGEASDPNTSSAASSEVDSESDLDDSDHDRSDGSDTEQQQVQHQPLNAAQAITLNRQHQQARIQQQQHQQQQHNRQQSTSGGTASTFGIMDGYNHRQQQHQPEQQQQQQNRQILPTANTDSSDSTKSDVEIDGSCSK